MGRGRLGPWRGLGADGAPVSHGERLLAALGGCLGLAAVTAVALATVEGPPGLAVVASIGASAVLLFAVPHGALSQPWPVLGGHLVSALVGVSCARWIPAPAVAAPAALGLALAGMYYLRCLHPPGGATALTAVLGGPAVHALGYGFVLVPVLLNVLVLLGAALLFNTCCARWRDPAAARATLPPRGAYPDISHADLVYALSQLDTFVDVSEDDLLLIYELATRRPHPQRDPHRPAGPCPD